MKMIALVAGIFFLLLGIAGFVPALSPDGQILGVLPANTVYSVIYIVAGAVGIMMGLSRRRALTPPPDNNGHDLRNFGL